MIGDDPTTQCTARHANQRCTKCAFHEQHDPMHESASYRWGMRRIDPPTTFGPQDDAAALARGLALAEAARPMGPSLALELLGETREALTQATRERNQARAIARDLAAWAVSRGYTDPRTLRTIEEW